MNISYLEIGLKASIVWLFHQMRSSSAILHLVVQTLKWFSKSSGLQWKKILVLGFSFFVS